MLRAFRVLSVVFFVALTLANCEQLRADTYEVGPFQVSGVGSTPEEAADDAYGQAWDIMVAVDDNLPVGDYISDFVVDSEGLVLPTMYLLEFHLVIEENPRGHRGR